MHPPDVGGGVGGRLPCARCSSASCLSSGLAWPGAHSPCTSHKHILHIHPPHLLLHRREFEETWCEACRRPAGTLLCHPPPSFLPGPSFLHTPTSILPGHTHLPPSCTHPPPSWTHPPPSFLDTPTSLLPGHTHLPPSWTQPPPSFLDTPTSLLPAHTHLPPSCTHPPTCHTAHPCLVCPLRHTWRRGVAG